MSWIKFLGLLLAVIGLDSFEPHSALARSPGTSQRVPSVNRPASLPLYTQSYRPRIAELRQFIQVHPHDAELRVALGRELEAIGDLAGAVSQYREALQLRPEHALAFYYLSRARRLERERSESQTIDSGSLTDRDSLIQSHVARGSALLASGDHAGAALEFRQVLQLDPSDSQARVGLGQALFTMGNVEGAITAYRSALRSTPDLAHARLQLAIALMVKEDWAAAQAELEKAIRMAPGLTEAHFHLGVVLYTLGDPAGAIAAYRQTLRLNPDFADAHYQLGLSLKLVNQEEEAAQEFLIAARTGLPQAQYFLGSSYLNGFGVARDRSAAIEWWFRAAEQGMEGAKEGLAQLRRDALLEQHQPPDGSQGLWHAFEDYRTGLWHDFPELSREEPADEVGARLLRVGRTEEAVPVLIREAAALSDRAQALLEALYEEGIHGHFAPFDRRILEYFEVAAAEGLPQPRLALARIYRLGLGVEPNPEKARGLLRDHPNPMASDLLREINADLGDTHVSTTLKIYSTDR